VQTTIHICSISSTAYQNLTNCCCWKILLLEILTGIVNSSSSNDFIEILRDNDNFLIQHVASPTLARGGDTPHILDLVICNDYFVEDIDYCVPLGKSNHASLVIRIWQSRFLDNITRHNFNRGVPEFGPEVKKGMGRQPPVRKSLVFLIQ
jgi:hypothetical protein